MLNWARPLQRIFGTTPLLLLSSCVLYFPLLKPTTPWKIQEFDFVGSWWAAWSSIAEVILGIVIFSCHVLCRGVTVQFIFGFLIKLWPDAPLIWCCPETTTLEPKLHLVHHCHSHCGLWLAVNGENMAPCNCCSFAVSQCIGMCCCKAGDLGFNMLWLPCKYLLGGLKRSQKRSWRWKIY